MLFSVTVIAYGKKLEGEFNFLFSIACMQIKLDIYTSGGNFILALLHLSEPTGPEGDLVSRFFLEKKK
ncbi:hypothetical protein, partial [Escherichia coli]|uniref:hypothetical protein n=1 Tax=Escherichia coli TaxID=562 RepID=UPI001A7EEA70